MNQTVLGIFTNRMDAESAVDDLETVGFSVKDISIVMKDTQEAERFAREKGTSVADSAVSGAVTGGVIGGIAGLLIGIGAIAVPGIGAILIGGPLAAAFGVTGAAATTVSGAATGVLAGGLIGALVGLGVSQEDAKLYENHIRSGGILVAIPAQAGREDDVVSILEDNGATQIRTINAEVSETIREEIQEPAYDSNRPYAYAPLGVKGGKSRSKKSKQASSKRKRTRSEKQ